MKTNAGYKTVKRAAKVIQIGGKAYDAKTGLLVEEPKVKETASRVKADPGMVSVSVQPKSNAANRVHKSPKKAKTLHSAVRMGSSAAGTKASRVIEPLGNVKARFVQKSRKLVVSPTASESARDEDTVRNEELQRKEDQTMKLVGSQAVVAATGNHVAADSLDGKVKLGARVNNFKLRHPSLIKGAAGSMAVLMLAGYFMYLNIPNLKLRVAASRAGFAASEPQYQPVGYQSNGPVEYGPGVIVLAYAESNGEEYKITQRQTNWDSRSLLVNHVGINDSPYQTFEQNGLTVYVYSDNRASWINQGVWYDIDGEGSLSVEQLVKIAGSI